jgi:hypothetical protein
VAARDISVGESGPCPALHAEPSPNWTEPMYSNFQSATYRLQ